MSAYYRPAISRKDAQALIIVLRAGLEHSSLTPLEGRAVLLFLNKITEREQMANILERLGQVLPDLVEEEPAETTEPPVIRMSQQEYARLAKEQKEAQEQEASMFTDWDDEALEHFIMAHPDKEDEIELVQAEIARRQRIKEQQPPSIQPPKDDV